MRNRKLPAWKGGAYLRVRLFFDRCLWGFRNRVRWRLKLAGYSVVVRGGGFRGISKYDFMVLKWLTKHPDFILITADKRLYEKAQTKGLKAVLIDPREKGEIETQIIKKIARKLRDEEEATSKT